jgi:transposase
MYSHVGGLDVHKKRVTVTVRVPDPRVPGGRREQTRTFRTFYADLLAMGAWLAGLGVVRVAMESTGVYWWPVYAALRQSGGAGLTVDVVNAQHVKAVPGRKTDVKDAQWLARLLEVGLLRGGFLPPDDIRALRDLTRYRTKLTEERTREKQRLLKVLEAAGIKLDVVASNSFGVSGRAMLDALAAGERDERVLAGLARGVLRNKIADLRLALKGRFNDHHGLMVGLHLARIDHLDRVLGEVAEKIGHSGRPATARRPAVAPAGLLAPLAEQIRLLTSIPGIGEHAAAVIVSEIGVDMSRFPTAKHLAAWAGLAPGNNESAGRRRRARHRAGNTHLQSILTEAAHAAAKTRTRIGARYHRLHRRFGGRASKNAGKKAAFAVAHTLIRVVWTILSTAQPYTDLGNNYYTHGVDPDRRIRRLIAHLEAETGKKITLTDHDHDHDGPDHDNPDATTPDGATA